MDPSSPPTTTLKATCLCGQLSASASVLTSSLPVDLWLCHCTTCRHVSGVLAVTCIWIRSPLTIFGTSVSYLNPDRPTRTVDFCGTCGTSVFEGGRKPALYSGALEVEGLVKVRGHEFVGDTVDGGLSVWMPQLEAFEGPPDCSLYNGPKEEVNVAKYEPVEKLNCTCKCGGVKFYITRPNAESRNFHSLYSDTIVPHHLGGDRHKNAEDSKWWISADGRKYAANLCACISCRRSSGQDIQQWAFVPQVNIFQLDGRPLDFSMGTLKEYNSSKGVMRQFCGTCGATIFWRSTERPKLVDVSVGLMQARSGSRAEEWLDWRLNRVSFTEFAQNRRLIGMLEDGLKDYKKKAGKT